MSEVTDKIKIAITIKATPRQIVALNAFLSDLLDYADFESVDTGNLKSATSRRSSERSINSPNRTFQGNP